MGQAKSYAGKLAVRFTYATNGHGIYAIDMQTGKEGEIAAYPTPDELWALTFAEANFWRDRFAAVPYEDKGGSHPGRYYQDIAIERVMQAVAEEKQRILLTLATGTGSRRKSPKSSPDIKNFSTPRKWLSRSEGRPARQARRAGGVTNVE